MWSIDPYAPDLPVDEPLRLVRRFYRALDVLLDQSPTEAHSLRRTLHDLLDPFEEDLVDADTAFGRTLTPDALTALQDARRAFYQALIATATAMAAADRVTVDAWLDDLPTLIASRLAYWATSLLPATAPSG